MSELTFVTGNADKYASAEHVSAEYGVNLSQASPDIDEVQSEDSEYIARMKAEAAYQLLKHPVIISDDSWEIPGLNGFPGPYMKSMNHWLSADDFLRLTSPLTDRRVFLIKLLVYKDVSIEKVVSHTVEGTILTEARGNSDSPWTKVVTMPGDNGKTIAEVYEAKLQLSQRKSAQVWHDFFAWYKDYSS
jgi:XTP/dITP diphosphohydrolase